MEGQEAECKLEDGRFQLDIGRNFLLWGERSNTGTKAQRGCSISVLRDLKLRWMQP